MAALATWAPEGGVLGAIAPLGLAVAAGTALVVDLDPHGPLYPGTTSLASLVADGPRRADLSPPRRGAAVLRNGGISVSDAAEVVDALIEGWPAVVFRLPAARSPLPAPAAVVPVRSLLPGVLAPPAGTGPAVYQRTTFRQAPPGPGPVLPMPRAGTVQALLTGSLPVADRWITALGTVWGMPWE